MQTIKVAVSDEVDGKRQVKQYIMCPDEINDILVDYRLAFRTETNESRVMVVYRSDCFVHLDADTLTVFIQFGKTGVIVDLFREGKYFMSFNLAKEDD